jgi:hypothetical protein
MTIYEYTDRHTERESFIALLKVSLLGQDASVTQTNIRLLELKAGANLSHERGTTKPTIDVTKRALETQANRLLQPLNLSPDPSTFKIAFWRTASPMHILIFRM